MVTRKVEIMVGVFMLLGMLALAVLALRVSSINTWTTPDGYSVTARFENVGGLKPRSAVSAGGVVVGRVTDITYDTETYQAKVTMTLYNDFTTFPTDTSAAILTAGLLGEQYIGMEPGAEEEYLMNGSEIEITQSALVLEQVIGQFIFSQANKSGEEE